MRQLTVTDRLLQLVDNALRTLIPPKSRVTRRPSPEQNEDICSDALSEADREHSAGLMRINHTGEVCAQALYQGQALTSRSAQQRQALYHAAEEETDHLGWCERRLASLNSAPSWLNPLWYGGSFTLGIIAGSWGDGWNLGFVAETEKQVSEHLQDHLHRLPAKDLASRRVVEAMLIDEEKHAQYAINAGAKNLPEWVKKSMEQLANIMKCASYYL